MKLRRRAQITAAAVVLGASVLLGSQAIAVGAADGGQADYVVLADPVHRQRTSFGRSRRPVERSPARTRRRHLRGDRPRDRLHRSGV